MKDPASITNHREHNSLSLTDHALVSSSDKVSQQGIIDIGLLDHQ